MKLYPLCVCKQEDFEEKELPNIRILQIHRAEVMEVVSSNNSDNQKLKFIITKLMLEEMISLVSLGINYSP